MAVTTENANKVWMRAKAALAAASPYAQLAFKELKAWLATQKGNPDLVYVAIGDLGADAPIADAACKVYGIYLKKGATATGAFVKAADHATVSGTTASDLVLELNAAGQEAVLTYPQGWAQGTGFAIGSDTTADGSTASTSGDGPNGFVILGAA
jgi:hypothetical protein